jgi:hypothetical protein
MANSRGCGCGVVKDDDQARAGSGRLGQAPADECVSAVLE